MTEGNSKGCSVCLMVYNRSVRKPVILDCKHTFCQMCLQTRSCVFSLKCPSCGFVNSLPPEGIEALPINYQMLEAKNRVQTAQPDPRQILQKHSVYHGERIHSPSLMNERTASDIVLPRIVQESVEATYYNQTETLPLHCQEERQTIEECHVSSNQPKQFMFALGLNLDRNSLSHPTGLVLNADKLYVADSGNNRVKVFSLNGNIIQEFGCFGSNQGEFKFPCGVAMDTSNRLIVTDYKNHRVQIFERDGLFVQEVKSKHLINPSGISIDEFNRMIVCTETGVVVFSPYGKLLFRIKCGRNALRLPEYACFYKGNFIVSDTHDNSVKIFSDKGQLLRKYDGQFCSPIGIVPTNDALIICDSGNNRIQEVRMEGLETRNTDMKVVWSLGGKGCKTGLFQRPSFAALSPGGLLFVSDTDNHRIQAFQ